MNVKAFYDEDTFTEKEQVMIEMSARGDSHTNIGIATDVCSRTISRKLREPKFKKAIRKFCRDLFELRMRHVQSHWEKMENCFVAILDDEDTDTYAKIAAATQVKSMCFQARELDVEDELDELRDKIAHIEGKLSGAYVELIEPPSADDE